ncbi:hypothetical protein [Streptomyces sp. NPDC001985]|uniref:hypothetical protein n=1 Tax=Streptomyces sp. NPDC001985 TaxID=3154406 RepID=UPI00331C9FE5
MRNDITLTAGWVTAIQGALGAGGRLLGDGPWGMLERWWDVPTAGYLAITAAGLLVAYAGEAARRRARA